MTEPKHEFLAAPVSARPPNGYSNNTAGPPQPPSPGETRPARLFEAGVRIRRTGRRSRVGGALVEFTFVAPLLMSMMLGMLAWGWALHDWLILTSAVNTGGQLLAFSRGQTSDPCATTYSAITAAATSLNTANLTISYTIGGTTYTTNSCASATLVQSATATVTAFYPCKIGPLFTPFQLPSKISEIIQ